jgi:hypothetical protein
MWISNEMKPTMLFRLKAILFLFVLALPVLSAQSKKDKRDLLRDLETYKRVTMQLDVDSLLEFMPPKMLDMIPPEQLKQQLEQAFDNDELYMVFDRMTYGEITKIKKAGDYLCALVPYNGHMQMHFKETRDSAFLEMMVPMLEAQFAEGAIQIMGADTSLYLSIEMQQKNMIAFKKDGFNSWKMIEDKRSTNPTEGDPQMMMIKMFVPAEVLDATQ